ncbi:MAG: hypothetical protein KC418_05700 [Anaerolineales bacterium]|nr:hypothetical protein [Anaerolineales bacterium]
MALTKQEQQPYHTREKQTERRFVTMELVYAQAHDEAKTTHYHALKERHNKLLWAMDCAYKHQMWPEVTAFVRAIGLPEHGYLAVNGYWGEVKKQLEQALKAAEAEQDVYTGLQMLAEYGWLLYKIGQTAKAHSILQETLAAWKESKIPDPEVRKFVDKQIAGLHGRLAVIAQTEGDSKQQAYHLQQKRQIHEQLNDSEGLAYAYANQADMASSQGDIRTAAQLYQQAHTLFSARGEQSGLASIDFKMGMLAQRVGLTEVANDLLSSSLRQREASGHKLGVANRKLALGSQAEEEEDWTRAEQNYQDGLLVYQELGDRSGEAQALLMLGALSFQRQQWDKAHLFFTQTCNLYQEIGNQPGIATACCLLGQLALAQRDLVMAETYIQQSLTMGQKLKDEFIQAMAYLQLSAIAAARGEEALCLSLRREGLERLIMRDDLPADLLREVYQELDALSVVAPPRSFKQYLALLKRFLRSRK